MHDLDRQQLEQYEHEGLLGEYATGEVTEVQEMELAAQFLEITSEAELEGFLHDLFRSAKAAVGDAARTAYNSDLVHDTVIPALMKAAPVVARVAANIVEPGSGAAAADRAAVLADRAKMQADQWLRQELEGLSGEDREFEIARRYIRFAIDALQRALKAPPRVPGPVAAEIVVSEAARSHMPGIVPFVPELVGEASSVPRHRRSVMSTYEYQQGPYETEDEYGPFETGYETYEGEDEQFFGTLLGTIAKAVAPPLPGLAKGIFGALTSDGKGKGKGPLSATQEMELTAELLEITSEEELEEFLGNLFRGVAKTVGGVIGGPEGKALGGVLKGVAKQALPVVGALDGAVQPHAGGALGSLASEVFELELEGLTHEQAQFETGRSLVGLATTAAAHVAKTPPGAHPKKAVRAAMTKAARKHAPGLLSGAAGGPRGKQRRPRPGERPSPPAARRLGAAAFPDPDAADGASGHAGANGAAKAPADPSAAEPSFGAPEWDEPEPGDDAPDGGGARARSGRWIRRGGKILVLGV